MRLKRTENTDYKCIRKPLFTVLCVIFCIIFAVLPLATQATTGDNVPTDTLPAITEEYVDYTEEFLNANIYLFIIAVGILLICTVVMIVLKVKKRKS